MKFEPETVKGFQDILPPESLKRKAAKEIIESWFQRFGFVPIETPFIEYDELLRGDAMEEDEAVSDRFRLKDRGGRNLGLRYEFTVQLARIIKQNQELKLPFRRYQIGETFRDEPTGPGRFRQFTQCDADIIGDNSIEAELDCLLLAKNILKELNITAEINLNSRKLVNSIVESVQIEQKEKVLKELDKLDKIGEDLLKLNLKKYADTNQILTLFKLLEKPLKFFKDNAFEGAEQLQSLIKKAEEADIPVRFSPFLVRGLGYYTGVIFEIKNEAKLSIGAGGRYDQVAGKYLNREVPAVGISFGLERITSLAKLELKKLPEVIIISLGQPEITQTLAQKIRENAISCLTTNEKPGKALEYANATQIPFAIFIGDDEVKKKKYKLKNLATGNEELLSETQLIKKLKAT
ncbi:MAG TPA: histidine--tRNA ligase [Candidatus Nanoarchaeia archaeon]|nr:histidine--tRNA ligase [Candidatus Nanoarchaeia archaeon]